MQIQRDFGGTLIGFVAGLLVGLALALGVAIYVTKVPIPLVDRGVQRPPDDATKHKNWDPNATISGKPATTAPAGGAAPADGSATGPGAAASGTSGAPGTPGTTAGKDPLGDLAQSRQGAPAASGPSSAPSAAEAALPDPFQYYVQAGAFRLPEDADAQRAKLALSGFDAKVSEREQAGKLVYRVRVGPYGQKTEAEAVQEKLTAQGVETALVRVQR